MRELIKKHQPVIDDVMDVLIKHDVTPENGEIVLAWCVGLSAGARGAPLTAESIMRTMATAWQIGAEHGGSE